MLASNSKNLQVLDCRDLDAVNEDEEVNAALVVPGSEQSDPRLGLGDEQASILEPGVQRLEAGVKPVKMGWILSYLWQ